MKITLPPVNILFLVTLYSLGFIFSIYRAVHLASFDMLSLALIPALLGLILRAKWAPVVVIALVVLQTIVLLGQSTMIAIGYYLTPEDMILQIYGQEVSIPLALSAAYCLVVLQWWAIIKGQLAGSVSA